MYKTTMEYNRHFENLLRGKGDEEGLKDVFGKDATGYPCSTASLSYDDVIKLYFSVKPEYRRNAVWLVNDETAYTLRTMKDQDGNYLWNQEKGTILDRPVVYSQYMPSVATGAKPIAFGDLSYVWLLERSQLNIRVLVERYILAGMFGYAATERFDSKLIRTEAVKTLKIVVSEE